MKSFWGHFVKMMHLLSSKQTEFTVRKRNNLTTSVTLLDELPVSDLYFADNKPGIFPIET